MKQEQEVTEPRERARDPTFPDWVEEGWGTRNTARERHD